MLPLQARSSNYKLDEIRLPRGKRKGREKWESFLFLILEKGQREKGQHCLKKKSWFPSGHVFSNQAKKGLPTRHPKKAFLYARGSSQFSHMCKKRESNVFPISKACPHILIRFWVASDIIGLGNQQLSCYCCCCCNLCVKTRLGKELWYGAHLAIIMQERGEIWTCERKRNAIGDCLRARNFNCAFSHD